MDDTAMNGMPNMPTWPKGLLNQWDLADRWRMSPRTLERWRWEGRGPHYLKLGNRIAYRIEDVEAFEAANTMSPKGGTRLARHRQVARSVVTAA
jgi:hypothetical protein